YKEEFGEEINHKEASAMAARVLTLYELLARKFPKVKIAPSGYCWARRRPSSVRLPNFVSKVLLLLSRGRDW
ncbi:MAG TPA: hypothetical protein VHT93_16680, partial [Pseudolabrys sp.]|nr:hypothetical protein [Pseudolabrys sp.]